MTAIHWTVFQSRPGVLQWSLSCGLDSFSGEATAPPGEQHVAMVWHVRDGACVARCVASADALRVAWPYQITRGRCIVTCNLVIDRAPRMSGGVE